MSKTLKKIALVMSVLMVVMAIISGCDIVTESRGTKSDVQSQIAVGNKMAADQSTPKDIDFSLERYNLIKRAYWVNGQREKAESVICSVEKPLGYIVLFAGNAVVGSFIVDGKVSSLNSYLTPDSTYYSGGDYLVDWLPDVDGTYGENDNGIFFFTPDGKYIEWTGEYLYSDIPFIIADPVVKYEVEG